MQAKFDWQAEFDKLQDKLNESDELKENSMSWMS